VTASVIISIIALILTTATSIAITVLVSRALSSAFRTLDTMHKRQVQQLSGLLDRFQAIKWEDLAALRGLEEPAEGGFFPPASNREEAEGGQMVRTPFGSLMHRPEVQDIGEGLLDEDFDDDGEPRREAIS
jgi:hypothetical protein